MISEKAVERMLQLICIAPFDALKESELLLVAQHMQPRSYAGGEVIIAAGQVAEIMIVTLSGKAFARQNTKQSAVPTIIGAPSILFGEAIAHDIIAEAGGMDTLCLAKPHLFTLARECPDFVVGLTQIGRANFGEMS